MKYRRRIANRGAWTETLRFAEGKAAAVP